MLPKIILWSVSVLWLASLLTANATPLALPL